MDGLVPLGDSGFYSVPDDAAAPNDCERWPDSPVCSNQPFSALPIGFDDIEIIADECNKGFSITPVVAGIKLPKYQLVHREEKCRVTPPDTSVNREWNIYELPPQFKGIPAPPRPRSCIPDGEDFYCYVGIQTHQRGLRRSVYLRNEGNEFFQGTTKITPKIFAPMENTPIITWASRNNPSNIYQRQPLIACEYQTSSENQNYYAATGIYKAFVNNPSGEQTSNNSNKKYGVIYADSSIDIAIEDSDGEITEGEGRISSYNYEYNVRIWGSTGDTGNNVAILYGLYSDISKYLKETSKPLIDIYEQSFYSGHLASERIRNDYGVQVIWIKVDGEPVRFPKCESDKPPKEKKKRCCMGCCPPSPGDDSLLRAILKKVNEIDEDVEKLKKQIGEPVDFNYNVEKKTEVLKDFGFDKKKEKPATLFESIKFSASQVDELIIQAKRLKEVNSVLQPKEFYDAKLPKRILYPGVTGDEKIKGYADIQKAQIRQADKSAGLFPIEITLKDSDPAKKGDQKLTVKIQSMADALQLLISHAIDTAGDTDVTNNMAIRLLYEVGAVHKIVAANNQIMENIEEWCDYPIEHKKLDVPFAFNPFASSEKGFEKGGKGNIDKNTEASTEELLPELLKEVNVPLKVPMFKGGKTLNETLLEYGHHLLAISGTTTTPYKGVDALKTLIDSAVLAQKVHGFLTRENVKAALSGGEPEKVFSEIELGYENTAPKRTENISPYNRPKDNRPRVKKVSKRKGDKPTEDSK
ncbi:hypothetical protein H6F77_11635 [Microcoleus sp. FACHB-831]|uniref:hypothetical protein n=1 Tax=Microcoleus sp. FACHB-831 TaxID=2692827 RepID=UPI001682062D|nr:hypothetical protein [Microcoleus sp. FACHB-831]MBD1921743.1 hypothetical protein [Microcoleus sp. FACHB-831]